MFKQPDDLFAVLEVWSLARPTFC